MNIPPPLQNHLDIMCCPACSGSLEVKVEGIVKCAGTCGHEYPITDGLPQLFMPNDWAPGQADITEKMKAFYEKTPFPNYDDFDSVGSLMEKARRGIFAKLLDDQLPFGARVIECGCGTGQLSNFLAIANRQVIGADMCMHSLSLGNQFRNKHGIHRAGFLQMNLFRPCFKPGSFDVVISNGVLHHTSDCHKAFDTISTLVKPGGYLIVGLYHWYGRLWTDTRRHIFNLTNNRLKWLDWRLTNRSVSDAKKEAWFQDQYKNPYETKHTIGEVAEWVKQINFEYISSIPKSTIPSDISPDHKLFQPARLGGPLERFLVESAMIVNGGKEGGFFIVIARRPK
ncbi:MAG: methyltransferase domain-containing protein [Verrucomicrobiaceae bacterium]|nr:methyltransferase domain-containing protein [Verrucomicrobiaceae bacterium]